MVITRISRLTGLSHELELEVTPVQLQLWLDGMPIQQAMPDLTAAEREFILTGITAQEWEQAFNLGDMEPEEEDA